jgi:hypothetical protein
MSKIGKFVGIAAVVMGVLGAGFLAATPALAQTADPVLPGGPPDGYGPQGAYAGVGVNDATQEALAEALGVSVEELQAAYAAASEAGDVPEALGISQEAFQAAMQEVMQSTRGAAGQWAAENSTPMWGQSQMSGSGTTMWGQANRMAGSGVGTCGGYYSTGGARQLGLAQ